jgi:hypothetical protein
MSLNIYYQNVNSIRGKTHNFRNEVRCSDYDLIVLTETNLDDSFNDAEIFDDRYVVFRKDRDLSLTTKLSGVGIIFAVKKELKSYRIDKFESRHPVEDIWVHVNCHNGIGLLVNAVYLPCRSNYEVIKQYTDNFSLLSTEFPDDDILLIGDFNQPNIQWAVDTSPVIPIVYEGRCSDLLIESFNFCGFEQFNSCLNERGRILDLVVSNFEVSSIEVTVAVDILTVPDREHPPLNICLRVDPIRTRFLENAPNFNYKKARYGDINDFLDLCSWRELTELPTELAVSRFYEILNSVINIYVPINKFHKQKHPAWFSPELIKLLKDKKKHSNDPVKFREARRLAKIEIKNCEKRRTQAAEASIKEDPKKFWSYTKSLQKSGGFPNLMFCGQESATDPSEISNLFSTFFKSVYNDAANDIDVESLSSLPSRFAIDVSENDVLEAMKKLDCSKGPGPDTIPTKFFSLTAEVLIKPLSLLFNKSLNEGVFPSQWKTSFIIPIHKSGSKSDISNYRPISILNVLNKIFERIIHNKVFEHVRDLIDLRQHGFFPKRSTLTNLLDFTSYLLESTSASSQVDCIYTDFSKAFDKVDHKLLLIKLSRLGISGKLLK